MSVWRVGAGAVWAVGSFYQDPEPVAYISEWGGTFQVEDVEDGPLGSRRTLEDAVALAVQHNADAATQQTAHNTRVLEAIAAIDQAA